MCVSDVYVCDVCVRYLCVCDGGAAGEEEEEDEEEKGRADKDLKIRTPDNDLGNNFIFLLYLN